MEGERQAEADGKADRLDDVKKKDIRTKKALMETLRKPESVLTTVRRVGAGRRGTWSTPTMVPCTDCPFFSSIVTVSPVSFIKKRFNFMSVSVGPLQVGGERVAHRCY